MSDLTPPRARARAVGVVGVVGLAVLVVGTFLPWLRSGTTTRNSYSAGGAAQRLLDLGGVIGSVLDVWPFVALACAVAAALLLVGRLALGAVVGLLCAAVAGAAAAVVLTRDAVPFVAPAALGPAVTLVGAVLTGLAAVVLLTVLVRGARRRTRPVLRPADLGSLR